MQIMIRFICWTLVLAVGVFATMVIPFVPEWSTPLWFVAPIMIGGALALVGKNCGRGALLLAIPISVLLANAVVTQIWPPHVRHNIFRALNQVAKRDSGYNQLRRQLLPVVSQKLLVPPALKPGWTAGEHQLEVANGIKISLFATGISQPHSLAVDSGGVLFVSLPQAGQVVSLHDSDGDNQVDDIIIFCAGLDHPSGLAFKQGLLYVATATSIVALADLNHDYVADEQKIVTKDLAPLKNHWAHALVVGKDENLYVSVGADGVDGGDGGGDGGGARHWQQATVLRIGAEGTPQLFASGIHDCQGLALHPLSGSLWGADNGPQTIGYFAYPDELNVVVAGGDYGWPFCYGERKPDAKHGSVEICSQTTPSLLQLPAHSSPRGLAFGYDLSAPAQYRSMLYLTLQGESNGQRQHGFKLLGVPLASDGRIIGWGVDLISGWLVNGESWGQPSACVVGSDGCLYISDKLAGAIYRLSFPL
jgi:glucose/arabinose dehydrogenase